MIKQLNNDKCRKYRISDHVVEELHRKYFIINDHPRVYISNNLVTDASRVSKYVRLLFCFSVAVCFVCAVWLGSDSL